MSAKDQERETPDSSERRSEETARWSSELPSGNFPEGIVPPTKSATDVYCVFFHDDEVHACRDFVEILNQVFDYPKPVAYALTRKICESGRAVVWKGARNEAERMAQLARDHQPQWRLSGSVTAPHGVEKYVPPVIVTVERMNPSPSVDASTDETARECSVRSVQNAFGSIGDEAPADSDGRELTPPDHEQRS